MTRTAQACVFLIATSVLAACGAALAPIWQIKLPTQYNQLLRGSSENDAYVLRYGEDNTPAIYQITREGSVSEITAVALASTQVLGRLGQQIWVADDDYLDYTARDLLRAQALNLDDYSVAPALPDELHAAFAQFRGYIKQRGSLPISDPAGIAISGEATLVGQATAQPVIAAVNLDGSSHYELLSGDIVYHELMPLPLSSLYALRILYSQAHFQATGIYSRITFYDSALSPLQTLDLPQRLGTVTAFPDRLHASNLLDPGYMEIHTDGTMTTSERKGRGWNDKTRFLFHEDFFYAIEVNDQYRSVCRFNYELEETNCFRPRDDYWTSDAILLPDGTLTTAEAHRRIVLNGIEIALTSQNQSLLTSIEGLGYEESQIFYRTYTPLGVLISEIAAPPFKQFGQLFPCRYRREGVCLWDTTSVTAGTCGVTSFIPFSGTEVMASETMCGEGQNTGAITLWKNTLIAN